MKTVAENSTELTGTNRLIPSISCKTDDSVLRMGPQKPSDRMSDANSQAPPCNALLDHFRCPAEFIDIKFNRQPSTQATCFRFGHETCYGQLTTEFALNHPHEKGLFNAEANTAFQNGSLSLPFDPDDVIDNLRLERYLQSNAPSHLERALKDAYYAIRPLLPVNLRKHIQRAYLKTRASRAFPHWPVDTTVEDLCEHLLLLSMQAQGIDEIPFIWFWPNRARSAFAMTHDVETEKGRDFCTQLMDLDDSFGIKASFQIVPEERYALTSGFIQSIRDRGFEINLQDLNHDGNLFRDRAEFERRARKINRHAQLFGASGFRAAVLYRNFDWLAGLNFSYDMSAPNVAHLDPQPGGCCTVMPYFVGKMLEIPVTTTQDYTLFHLLNNYSLDLWKTQINHIMSRHGLASFIVHPDYILEKRARRVYTDLLTFLRELNRKHNIWFALPAEINRWWRARQQMRIVNRSGAWQIEGDGSASATLAFARRIGDRLEYELAEPKSQNAK
ncbi:MAG TPA: hypothetical protein VF753_02720 [Terriglobales bacterium]